MFVCQKDETIVHLSFWNNISERENRLAQRENTECTFFIHKKVVHIFRPPHKQPFEVEKFPLKRLIDVPTELVSQTSEGLNFSFGVFFGMILLVTKTTSHENLTKTHELEKFWSGQRDKSGICLLRMVQSSWVKDLFMKCFGFGAEVLKSSRFFLLIKTDLLEEMLKCRFQHVKRYDYIIFPSWRWKWKIETRDVFKSIYIIIYIYMLYIIMVHV